MDETKDTVLVLATVCFQLPRFVLGWSLTRYRLDIGSAYSAKRPYASKYRQAYLLSSPRLSHRHPMTTKKLVTTASDGLLIVLL